MTSRFRGRSRQMLHTARVRRQTEASPTRQLPSLPSLISLAEIRQLREQVRPVSLVLLVPFLDFFLIPSALSLFVHAATAS